MRIRTRLPVLCCGVALGLVCAEGFCAATESNRVTRAASAAGTNGLSSFRVEPGFRIEVVAAEPLVASPIAIAFDEGGKMYVAETPQGLGAGEVARASGRIRLLQDPDERGEYRSSIVLAENVVSPSALACYSGGVFVASGGDVLYLKDSTGDGLADVRKIVLSGFGGSNAVTSGALLNNFNWGLNGRIHGGTAGLGGLIVATNAASQPVSVERKDFSFDPRNYSVFPETGPAFSGLSFDNSGRKFVCDPSRPLRLVVSEARYGWRYPFFPRAPDLLDVAGPATTAFHLVADAAAAAGESKSNLMAVGWLTNAHGVVVYRGNAFPSGYAENVFVCDPDLHLVHRMVLREAGLGATAVRPANERNSEFVMSQDRWFQPVQAVNAPDGTLYIVDRRDGRDGGRIYRVAPELFKNPKPPQLRGARAYDLVAALANPNGWHRDTAARLLLERQDPAAAPLLSAMLTNAALPVARVEALYALTTSGALAEGHVLRALGDTNALVRQHGLVAAENLPAQRTVSPALWEHFKRLAGDPSLRVRYQLAFSLGEVRHPERHILLARILARDATDGWVQSAVLSSLSEGAGALMQLLGSEARFRNNPAGLAFLQRLAGLIGTRGREDDVTQATEFISRTPLDPLQAYRLAYALGDGLHRTRSSLALVDTQKRLAAVYGSALAKAVDASVAENVRAEAVRMIGVSPFTFNETSDWLLLICNPQPYGALRAMAIETVGRYDDPRVLPSMLERWGVFPPLLRRTAVMTLLGRSDRVPAVLGAIERGEIVPGDLPGVALNFLRTYREPGVRERALKLFGPVPIHRLEAFDQFKPALRIRGRTDRGRGVFQSHCSACHQAGGAGEFLGPDLTGARTFSKERLLSAIVEPSVSVAAEFATCVVETEEGENLVGIKTDDNPASITLRQVGGASVWPRLNVRFAQTQFWSLMPEGLEQGLTTQDMADLLDFLITGS
ncbi:MAG TPA: PVC-type heme-binding CxxCH protein [Verrucomicrobiae bacterium]